MYIEPKDSRDYADYVARAAATRQTAEYNAFADMASVVASIGQEILEIEASYQRAIAKLDFVRQSAHASVKVSK